VAFNINDSGEIIGIFQDTNTAIETGFIYNAGSFTTLTYPGAEQIFPYGINDSGEIVGQIFAGSGADRAFIYSDGVFSFLQVPVPGAITWARGINNLGQVTGYYDVGGVRHGFIYSNGAYETIDYPSTDYTQPLGINDFGHIVGSYNASGVPEPPTWAMFIIGFRGLGLIIRSVRRRPRSAPVDRNY
jgi:probable HAF family extracellular repeat protein